MVILYGTMHSQELQHVVHDCVLYHNGNIYRFMSRYEKNKVEQAICIV